MIFTDILTETRRFVKDNATRYSTAEITESANRAQDRITGLIRQAEGRWQWDDSSNTDFAIATTTLTTDIQDYSLDPTHYRIERVEVKDETSTWTKLIPIDQSDIYNQSLTDFMSGSGVPQYYDKVGNSLILYPKPNYTQANSLKVFYERGPDYFETTDTTKTPGFNPLFHRLVPLWAAYDYAFINGLDVTDRLRAEITVMENQLQDYYSLRDKDDRPRLRARINNYR